ncbi:microtubule -associated protein EB1 [Phytophthora cinnamomi]|uniref:microtubule -associated protein EB1 n=1 Tax=Phytophthora cinnamomi TaxID=4785 RepID=UPI00355AACAB|nr:microtubule -associated protein EB1 [Phytophthora cinnamomi]
MAAADQSMSLMDGTYFVGRKEILDWINGLCAVNLAKVEQTCTGAVACQILDAMYPGKVQMSKVDWAANKDYEYIQNYKVLQKAFMQLKIDKHVEVDRLVRGKYQDNLEFMQWFKAFYERNASGQPYDPIAQRDKGKGGAQFTHKFGGGAASSAPAAPARRKLTANNEALTNESGELRAMVESLEKERDFYFNKLREVEIMLQGTEDSEANPLAQEIFKVLYATEEEGAEEEQMAGEPQDEQM